MRYKSVFLSVVLPVLACIQSMCGGVAWAAEIDTMYSSAELERAAATYSPNLRGIWLEDFGRELTPTERQVAMRTTLNLPLRGRNGHPFDFYANSLTGQVTIPIFFGRQSRSPNTSLLLLAPNGLKQPVTIAGLRNQLVVDPTNLFVVPLAFTGNLGQLTFTVPKFMNSPPELN